MKILVDHNTRCISFVSPKAVKIQITNDLPERVKKIYEFSNFLVDQIELGKINEEQFVNIIKRMGAIRVIKADLVIDIYLFLYQLSSEARKEELTNLETNNFYKIIKSQPYDHKLEAAIEIRGKFYSSNQAIARGFKTEIDKISDDKQRITAYQDLLERLKDSTSSEYQIFKAAFTNWIEVNFKNDEFQKYMLDREQIAHGIVLADLRQSMRHIASKRENKINNTVIELTIKRKIDFY